MTTETATLSVTFTARIEERIEDGRTIFTVWPTAHVEGVTLDRPDMSGWGCTSRRNAERMVRAVEAGAVLYDFEVRADVNGKTYLGARSRVLGRMMNADLTRLGF